MLNIANKAFKVINVKNEIIEERKNLSLRALYPDTYKACLELCEDFETFKHLPSTDRCHLHDLFVPESNNFIALEVAIAATNIPRFANLLRNWQAFEKNNQSLQDLIDYMNAFVADAVNDKLTAIFADAANNVYESRAQKAARAYIAELEMDYYHDR